MKIEFINPSYNKLKNYDGVKNFKFECITLASMAAHVPSDIEVTITDEIVNKINFETDADIIGISSLTNNAPRAYWIADEFRKRGKKVLLGGVHASICTEEAKAHADAVITGEGEEVIQEVIRDIKTNQLKPVYSADPVDLDKMRSPRYDLLSKKYIPVRLVQTVRGCPNSCSFCSNNLLHGHRIRRRNIDNVVKDIYTSPLKMIFIIDDNFNQTRKQSIAIMKEIIGAKKNWFGYATTIVGDDDEWLDLAQQSGCKGLFIGFESLDKKCLESVNKKNDIRKYERQIKKIREYGIPIVGGFIFGFDNEMRSNFKTTLDFVLKNRIDMFACSALTPFPGTKLYNDLLKENRLDNAQWWMHGHRCHDLLFKPRGELSKEEIKGKIKWITKEFYKFRHFFDRLTHLPVKSTFFDFLSYIIAFFVQRNVHIVKYNKAK